MTDRRFRILLCIFAVMAGASLYFLADRMLLRKETFYNAGYIDKAFTSLINNLIEEGIIRLDGKIIVIDEAELMRKNFKEKTRQRVLNSLPYLYEKNGKVCFDNQSVSIVNSRIFSDSGILRGGFLDRKGKVIAASSVDDKSLKQERHYAHGPEFFHVTGHWNAVYGKRGLEKALDEYLSGTKHPPVYRKTSNPLRDLQLGDNITLTLDSGVQIYAYELLKGKKGAVVVLNINTGEVIAAVSAPSFDPETKEREAWKAAFADTGERPYENRAFSALYPPGSTFKTIVASAWLEEQAAAHDKQAYTAFCNGRKNHYGISDIHSHGKSEIAKAYSESCNVFFSEIGVGLGPALLNYVNRFGFNHTVNLTPQLKEISYQAEGSPAFAWLNNKSLNKTALFSPLDFKRNPKLVAQGSIGQNLVMATPLQMAMTAAAVANRGVMMNPYIVKEIRSGDSQKVVFSSKPVVLERPVSEKTAGLLRRLMTDVMRIGTGKDVKKIYLENGRYTAALSDKGGRIIAVAGKTGTAEVGDKNGDGKTGPDEKPHSWFVGFAPADKPRFAVAVVAENQGFGSLTAAPIAMDVLAKALDQERIK